MAHIVDLSQVEINIVCPHMAIHERGEGRGDGEWKAWRQDREYPREESVATSRCHTRRLQDMGHGLRRELGEREDTCADAEKGAESDTGITKTTIVFDHQMSTFGAKSK